MLRRNAAKVDGRTLELANAPELGEDSVAEETEQRLRRAGHPGILFEARRPSREPSPEMDDEKLRELLAEVYAGAPWVDLERLLREVRDPGAPWPEIAAVLLQRPVRRHAGRGRSRRCGTRAERDRELVEGERLGARLRRLAFAATGRRWSAARATAGCSRSRSSSDRRTRGEDWRVDRCRIHRALEHMFATYDVAFLYADPWKWQDELEEWADALAGPDRRVADQQHVSGWPAAVDRFRVALEEGRVTHDGDDGSAPARAERAAAQGRPRRATAAAATRSRRPGLGG